MNALLFDVLLAWTAAFVVAQTAAHTLRLREYYATLPLLTTTLGDYAYTTLILLASIAVYTTLFKYKLEMPRPGNTAVILPFVATFVGVQWAFDLVRAAVVASLPMRSSAYLESGKKNALMAAAINTVYCLLWLGVTYAVVYATGDLAKYALILAGVFLAVAAPAYRIM